MQQTTKLLVYVDGKEEKPTYGHPVLHFVST